jgi:hypothetical protein
MAQPYQQTYRNNELSGEKSVFKTSNVLISFSSTCYLYSVLRLPVPAATLLPILVVQEKSYAAVRNHATNQYL